MKTASTSHENMRTLPPQTQEYLGVTFSFARTSSPSMHSKLLVARTCWHFWGPFALIHYTQVVER